MSSSRWIRLIKIKDEPEHVFGESVGRTVRDQWGLPQGRPVDALGLLIIIAKSLPKHKTRPPPPDKYTLALRKALLFFNAQKSGKLPKSNGIPWRGNSGLQDGSGLADVKGGLVGGYHDAGDNTKFHFPMSFAMTMLSWSVIEYEHKYRAIGEYNHIRDLIKWGNDYLLLTFNSSATKINQIHSQKPIQMATSGPDIAGEMAAALAAASIVFRDDSAYSRKLAKGAATVFDFARDGGKRTRYCSGNPHVEPYYNSTGYYDEYMWGAAWLYYATSNNTYLSLATNEGMPRHSKAFYMIPDLSVLTWDNKLPAAMLLLTRLRIFLSPGYPYEEMLQIYHNVTGLTTCSYLQRFNVFNWTRGGLIQLNHGRGQNLQHVANAAFLASLFADYLNATGIEYILGANPMNMSYVVGFGTKFPRHVHHRGSSIPHDNKKYTCKGGWQWANSCNPNPNTITGAMMVGGPDRFDKFQDVRAIYSYTEPAMAGNAGLVAALVSLTGSGRNGVNKNIMFTAVPPMYPASPPPPAPWKP
ncbi:hypothetical protein RJ639_019009 [Escallonia herrerae]|uniref:Endoglucanase n=1 Tax=Escallonia herrerae TaxID=1293975 RepID=A0AA88V9I4_9ASTE|nr:hypothetical protein RJ639_019009 [Escallonia herrerae]